MLERLSIAEHVPDIQKAAYALEMAIRGSGIDPGILHLLKIRASQINGCAYCIDMHVRESLADGLDAHKLHLIAAWQEARVFDAKERAALAWTEGVTRVSETGVPDALYQRVREQFSEQDIARLTAAVSMINFWNRIAVSTRMQHPDDVVDAA